MAEYRGYESTQPGGVKVVLSVGELAGRKRPSLYVTISNEYSAMVCPLASFSSEEAADRARDLLDHFIMREPLCVPAEQEKEDRHGD